MMDIEKLNQEVERIMGDPEIRSAYDPTLPRTLNAAIDRMQALSSYAGGAVSDLVLQVGRSKFGEEPACGRCTSPACCWQVVSVTLMEALPIARALRHLNQDTAKFLARLEDLGQWQRSMNAAAWFNMHEPCPFQDQQNRCMIYAQRPIACRQHFAWTPDPLYCRGDSPESVQARTLRLAVEMVIDTILLAEQSLRVSFGIHRESLPVNVLPTAVLSCFRAFAAATRGKDDFRRALEQAPALTPADLEVMRAVAS